MIDQRPVLTETNEYVRDERSMRIVEIAMAITALGAALLLAIR